MSTMRNFIIGTIVALTGAISGIGVATAAPRLQGSWQITACDDAARTACTTQCFTFTRVPGTIVSNPLSGTWVSGDGGGFSGNFSQVGDQFMFWGVSTGAAPKTTVYFKGAFSSPRVMNGTRFIVFTMPNDNSRVGNWHGDFRRGCPQS